MFNNLQIRTCHTFDTHDCRPIKLYKIGRDGQRPRDLHGLPMQIEKSMSSYDIVNRFSIGSSPMADSSSRLSIRPS